MGWGSFSAKKGGMKTPGGVGTPGWEGKGGETPFRDLGGGEGDLFGEFSFGWSAFDIGVLYKGMN